MSTHQPTKSIFTVGSRYPRPIAWLRLGIGIYLMVLTTILYSTGHGGQWAWLLLVVAALHFGLAGRLFRIAHRTTTGACEFE